MAEGPTILECPLSTGHHLVVYAFSLLIQHYQQTYSTMFKRSTLPSNCAILLHAVSTAHKTAHLVNYWLQKINGTLVSLLSLLLITFKERQSLFTLLKNIILCSVHFTEWFQFSLMLQCPPGNGSFCYYSFSYPLLTLSREKAQAQNKKLYLLKKYI